MKTLLVSAFPGTGKTWFHRNTHMKCLDSDSSTFDKADFPANYIRHIRANMGSMDIIMISSHKEVRDALVEAGLKFVLVYPSKAALSEYLRRYKERGSPEGFIKLLEANWGNWIEELIYQGGCRHLILPMHKYLSDYLGGLDRLQPSTVICPDIACRVHSKGEECLQDPVNSDMCEHSVSHKKDSRMNPCGSGGCPTCTTEESA